MGKRFGKMVFHCVVFGCLRPVPMITVVPDFLDCPYGTAPETHVAGFQAGLLRLSRRVQAVII
jgi:hypothetical protein